MACNKEQGTALWGGIMKVTHLHNEVTLRLHSENLFKVTVKDVVDRDFSYHRE